MAFDEQRDQYLWFIFGWEEKRQMQHIIMHLCIKNGKIWGEANVNNSKYNMR
ncbi:XisI protein [Nostocales cyanobacterium LEGE 11386]|nr:XisI protein [Nostocales cyanobacterium LEGE 11386]